MDPYVIPKCKRCGKKYMPPSFKVKGVCAICGDEINKQKQ